MAVKWNLNTKIADCDLSIRVKNCLLGADVKTIRDLVCRSDRELLMLKNMGRVSVVEVVDALSKMGLSLRDDAEANNCERFGRATTTLEIVCSKCWKTVRIKGFHGKTVYRTCNKCLIGYRKRQKERIRKLKVIREARQAKILDLRFRGKKTYREIGEIMGISGCRVNEIIQKALWRMQKGELGHVRMGRHG